MRQEKAESLVEARATSSTEPRIGEGSMKFVPKNYGDGPYFFKKNRLRRAKIDWILEPIPKKIRLRRAEYLLT